MSEQAMQKDMDTLLAKVQIDMSKLMRERDELVAALRFVIEQTDGVPMLWEKALGDPARKANNALATIKFNARAALAKVSK